MQRSLLPMQLLLLLLLLLLNLHQIQAFRSDHICNTVMGRDCCPGWSRDSDGKCNMPVCSGNCGTGKCVGPNLCYCSDGSIRYSCGLSLNGRPGSSSSSSGSASSSSSSSSSSRRSCSPGCMNGGVCSNGRCLCSRGFTGNRCQISPTCPSNCSGRGSCQPTGRCSCNRGFSGNACHVEVKGRCYTEAAADGSSCSKPLTSSRITRELCCSSFGKAWGDGHCSACAVSACGNGRVATAAGCRNISLCDINGICGAGSCEQISSSDIRCHCPSGQVFNQKLKICQTAPDYCEQNRGVCGGGGTCVSDGAGSFTCKCNSGFLLRSDAKFCYKNACSSSSSICSNGRCVATPDSENFTCSCDPGFDPSSDRRSCVRRTYCSLNPAACGNGTCLPDGQFYTCRCNSGFRASPSGLDCFLEVEEAGGTSASPAAACASRCGQHGQCRPAAGGRFACECNSGWRLAASGDTCEQAPMADAPAGRAGCVPGACAGGRCRPVGSGDFRCSCGSGHRPGADGRSCQKLPYCLSFPSTCANGRCVSISAIDFECECSRGFRLADDRRSCLAVSDSDSSAAPSLDPCQALDVCKNGMCINIGGSSFMCACYRGYKAIDKMQRCRKKTYCESNPKLCSNGRCVDLGGDLHRCDCMEGFNSSSDGKACLRHQPNSTSWLQQKQQQQQQQQQQVQQQQQKSSSYCQRYPHACGTGQCLDLRGSHSFTCSCPAGYKLTSDKRHCSRTQMQEWGKCKRLPLACRGAGHCVNYANTYQCFCYSGFRHRGNDRKTCWPYDYNKEMNSIAIHGISVSDTKPDSSSSSQSQSSIFKMDGSIEVIDSSEDKDYAKLQVQADSSDTAAASAAGACNRLSASSAACDHGSCSDLADGGFECHCNFGFTQSSDRRSCVDFDECAVAGTQLCLMGECVNTLGSYTCKCKQGFRLDSKVGICVDRNECRESADLCRNGRCVNQWGSFECRCNLGFRLEPKMRQSCLKIDHRINFDGSIEVIDDRCPSCRFGCSSADTQCRCGEGQKIVGGLICLPSESSNIELNLDKGELKAALPQSSSSRSVQGARRSVRQLGCSIGGLLPADRVQVSCSFQVDAE